jgi:hypothetical protein
MQLRVGVNIHVKWVVPATGERMAFAIRQVSSAKRAPQERSSMVIAGGRPILVFTGRNRSMRPASKLRSLAGTEAPGGYVDARLVARRPGNGSHLSTAKSPSSDTSADPHARLFGLSLAALWAACLVLNAASPSALVCQLSDRDFGTSGTDTASASTRVVPGPEDGWHVQPSGTIRSKACATNEGGEEPGY